MPRPKTDQEIQKGWEDLQWKFMNWFNANTAAICQCYRPGADWDAFDQLVAKAFPQKEHRGFPSTNFTNNQAVAKPLKTTALSTILNPMSGPDVVGKCMIIMKVKPEVKPELGAVYVVYNDCPLKDEDEEEEFEEYTGPSEKEPTNTEGAAANHEPGKVHPSVETKFRVARIADSIGRLGDIQRLFNFEVITSNYYLQLSTTKIMTDNNGKRFIPHAKDPPNAGSPATKGRPNTGSPIPRQPPNAGSPAQQQPSNTESHTRRDVDW
ncbi:hypothetical protein F52700_2961 [Fusarium sp. NRRL 52700]|nr:hypothetical protein F52700_2961 [Fusarium sp. NRRL 52700]